MGRATRSQTAAGVRDDGLAESWLADLRAGVSDVEARILREPATTAAAGVRALGQVAGAEAVPLLALLGMAESVAVAEAACEALGSIRAEAAAEALQEIAESAAHRAVQKAARRGVYRLSSQGIRVEARAPVAVATVGAPTGSLYRAVASGYDGRGDRALWLGVERPLGGVYAIALTVNDRRGLTQCTGLDTTRKRFAEREAELRNDDDSMWVELPLEYAQQLVQEAVETARESGSPATPSTAVWTDLIGAPAEPFQQALVYKEISSIEVRLHPTLENETPRLFEQSEIDGWLFLPDEVQKWARQIGETGASRLLVTAETDEQRVDRLIREAARELLTKPVLHALRRRLEETAYIFLRTERIADARRAVAAAVTIEEVRPLRPLHPFLRFLVNRSFGVAVEIARVRQPSRRLVTV